MSPTGDKRGGKRTDTVGRVGRKALAPHAQGRKTMNVLKRVLTVSLSLLVVLSVAALVYKELAPSAPGQADGAPAPSADAAAGTRLVAYYFHGDQRCASCLEIEARSREALETYFAEELREGTVAFKTVNVQRPANQHYIQEFALYAPAFIVARQGERSSYRDLTQALYQKAVGTWEEYVLHVRDEVRALLRADP